MTADATTPTVSELLNASVEDYTQGGQAADLTPFLVNGQQMQATDYANGLYASVWLTPGKQVVIAYEGTYGNTPDGSNLSFLVNELVADEGIISSSKPVAAEINGLAFAQQVAAAAAGQGISASNIFVTGHSLGATIAAYVAESTGWGGIGFEPLGIAPAVGTVGNGSNFVSVDTYGDAIPGYASNETALGPVAPTNQPLYGQVLHIGDPAWQAPLTLEADAYGLAIWLGGQTARNTAETELFAANILDHAPLTQAHALGVTLSPSSNLFGIPLLTLGNTSGPVLDVADDTITQLTAYIQATDGNTKPAPATQTASVAGQTQVARHFIDTMASFAPQPAVTSDAEIGVQASNGVPSLVASSAMFRTNGHVTVA